MMAGGRRHSRPGADRTSGWPARWLLLPLLLSMLTPLPQPPPLLRPIAAAGVHSGCEAACGRCMPGCRVAALLASAGRGIAALRSPAKAAAGCLLQPDAFELQFCCGRRAHSLLPGAAGLDRQCPSDALPAAVAAGGVASRSGAIALGSRYALSEICGRSAPVCETFWCCAAADRVALDGLRRLRQAGCLRNASRMF